MSRTAENDAACIFCQIIAGEAPAEFIYEGPCGVAFRPLGPVTPGHVLVVPLVHVEDFTTMPAVTAEVANLAAHLARDMGSANLITSAGAAATQTVKHLHFHIVPRREGDGLALPWTGQTRLIPPAEEFTVRRMEDGHLSITVEDDTRPIPPAKGDTR